MHIRHVLSRFLNLNFNKIWYISTSGAGQRQSFPEGITNHQVEQCISKYLQNNNDKQRNMEKCAAAVDARHYIVFYIVHVGLH